VSLTNDRLVATDILDNKVEIYSYGHGTALPYLWFRWSRGVPVYVRERDLQPVTAKIVYSVSTGSFDGGSCRKYDAGYFEWIFTNLRGFCEKSKASSRLFARPSV
jgi:hypothetical protein